MEKQEKKENKSAYIILILLILLLLAAIAYFFFFYKWPGTGALINPPAAKQEENKTNLSPAENAPVVKQAEKNSDQKATPAPKEETVKFNLQKTAESFAERFGSYSNQSNYGNITDLYVLMSAEMQKWAEDYVAKAKKENPYNENYQGMMTQAISSELKSFSDSAGTATVLVSAQRTQSAGAVKNNAAYYEDILIGFVKDGSVWKVDSAKWQGKK